MGGRLGWDFRRKYLSLGGEEFTVNNIYRTPNGRWFLGEVGYIIKQQILGGGDKKVFSLFKLDTLF